MAGHCRRSKISIDPGFLSIWGRVPGESKTKGTLRLEMVEIKNPLFSVRREWLAATLGAF